MEETSLFHLMILVFVQLASATSRNVLTKYWKKLQLSSIHMSNSCVLSECPKYPGFCITRQKSEYPFIEMFHSPEHATNQGKVIDPSTTKYSVKVLPFNHDLSVSGFREFFKRHGIQSSDPSEIVG